jgi:hypothetical protein
MLGIEQLRGVVHLLDEGSTTTHERHGLYRKFDGRVYPFGN